MIFLQSIGFYLLGALVSFLVVRQINVWNGNRIPLWVGGIAACGSWFSLPSIFTLVLFDWAIKVWERKYNEEERKRIKERFVASMTLWWNGKKTT